MIEYHAPTNKWDKIVENYVWFIIHKDVTPVDSMFANDNQIARRDNIISIMPRCLHNVKFLYYIRYLSVK